MRACLLAAIGVVAASSAFAGNRMEIRGRDVYLDDKPHIPHGMIHVGLDQYAALQKLGINSLSLDVAFRDFDPQRSEEENRAAHAGYLKAADEAHRHGMTVLWLMSFHYTPDWLWQRYPDVRMKKHDGTDGEGGWMRMCLNHPGFRADAEKWLRFFVGYLGDHPATVGYVMWNEPHLTAPVDYNPHTVRAFHGWLEKRYGTVAALNEQLGLAVEAFDQVSPPPPPDEQAYWSQMYDQMVAAGRPVTTAPAPVGNPALWMDWMRFRQENFADFWVWERSVIKDAAPDAIVTSKIVPFDLYSSHAYGAGTNTEIWVNRFLDVLGMDLYSHQDEDFLARWKCDYFLSLSAGKPVWHTEYGFSFCAERGLTTPEQWRSTFYHQLARGVGGFWNYMWGEPDPYTLHYRNYKPAPVTHQIGRLSKQMETLAPLLAGLQPERPQVAVLHSATTSLAIPNDYTATADQTTIIDLLYRSQTPFNFVTEQMVREGKLRDYRVLAAVGAVALDDETIEAIRQFTVDNGGHVIANARFAELDEYGRPRAVHPPQWMAARTTGFYRQPREKTGVLELRRTSYDIDEKEIDVHVQLETWSSRPIRLESGEVLGSGPIFGDEDTQMAWASGGRHELFWEDIEPLEGGRVIGYFEDGKPAVVETPQTLYVARDVCWVDEGFERFFRGFLRQSGVTNKNLALRKGTSEPAASVDVRLWENDDRKVLFVTNSAPTLHYDGKPLDLEVLFEVYGEVTDALTGERIPSRWENFTRVVPLTLVAGEARVLVGKPYPAGWEDAKARYEEVHRYVRPDDQPYVTWWRSPKELWVCDNRTELGIGTHGMSDEHAQMVRQLGIRLVRHTIYWYNVERTDQPGVYDEAALKHYDEITQRAKDMGIELVYIIHGNPPGAGWESREATYQRFADFAAFMAKRYPSVRYWELWNEWETTFTDIFGAQREYFPPFEMGRCYGRMLQKAYPAIKQANPEAFVLIGGLSYGDPTAIIRGIYEQGARECFDVMNIHTYGVPVNWGFVVSGYQAKAAMGEYGDSDRPLWNTEFGIDAGNLYRAWQVATGEGFDEGHLKQWKACIADALKTRLYWKILPYQLAAGNETANDVLNDPNGGVDLGEGRVADDYGFGLLRADGVTPRPTYRWLERARINRKIQAEPRLVADVRVACDPALKPVGYEFEPFENGLVVKDVTVNSLAPTVIRFR